jgi:hypothetical protein
VTRTARRTSPHLRLVLREIEYSGSDSAVFWRFFWQAYPYLGDEDLLRVALAAGERGRAVFRAVTEQRATRPHRV